MSSRAILAWMERDLTVAAMNGNRMEYPRDPADLGRCIRLLDIEPSYRTRIGEMAQVSPQWARLVAKWAKLEALYREEEPTGYAPKCGKLMQELIDGGEHVSN
jgi:hypothetical protein